MLAIIATADDTLNVVEFDEDKSYETLSKAVGGLIECVNIPSLGVDMWINEEGKVNGLDLNGFGCALWVSEYGYTDIIVGDVIITGGVDEEGRTLGLTDRQVEKVLSKVYETLK